MGGPTSISPPDNDSRTELTREIKLRWTPRDLTAATHHRTVSHVDHAEYYDDLVPISRLRRVEYLGTSMWYSLLADFVVVIHVLYVGYILAGQMAILVGGWRRWSWVRNRWFRWTHLTAISIVALEAVSGIVCPLTVWENDLRRLAGETPAEETFIGRAIHTILFFDLPEWVFTTVYVLFAVIVLATLRIVPIRRSKDAPLKNTA
jgi:hypothetical protein